MSSRRTVPLAINGQNTSPASMVFPNPTSSATSQRVGHVAKTRRQTHNWCGSNAMREVERTPHVSFTDSMAAACARVPLRSGNATAKRRSPGEEQRRP